ncbi:MAG TPA: hypothetical protein VK174_13335 [Chitinophagales bacterium]|nr:hypothetical protein [Chitinophagales bacterium]
MRAIAVLFSVCLLTFALSSCHLKEKRAKEYHDTILQKVQAVIDNSLEYGDALQSYEKNRALQSQQKYLTMVNETMAKIEEMKDFEGDTTLHVYSRELLAFYKKTLEKEHGPFLQAVTADAFSDEEKLIADSLTGKFAMDENLYWERFNWAERKFYKEEDIALVEK